MGDYYYVLSSGVCDIFVNGKKVLEVHKGRGFGELALLYDAPRAATVVASSDDVRTWAVDRITFKQVMIGTTMKKVCACACALVAVVSAACRVRVYGFVCTRVCGCCTSPLAARDVRIFFARGAHFLHAHARRGTDYCRCADTMPVQSGRGCGAPGRHQRRSVRSTPSHFFVHRSADSSRAVCVGKLPRSYPLLHAVCLLRSFFIVEDGELKGEIEGVEGEVCARLVRGAFATSRQALRFVLAYYAYALVCTACCARALVSSSRFAAATPQALTLVSAR